MLGGSPVLPMTDDGTQTATLPFVFTLFHTQGQAVWFSSNGAVGLGSASTSVYTNECLPTAEFTGDVILPYWDDLHTRNGVCSTTVGAAPNRQFIITWSDIYLLADSTSELTFSVVLNEGSDVIYMQYAGPTAGMVNGASATIGLQAASTSPQTLQYLCDAATLTVPSTIVFTPQR
jgi:hypothetical protein